jgi:hypothetical protein
MVSSYLDRPLRSLVQVLQERKERAVFDLTRAGVVDDQRRQPERFVLGVDGKPVNMEDDDE